MRYQKAVLTLLLVGLAGCAHNQPYRTQGTPGCVKTQAGDCRTSVRHLLGSENLAPYITYVEFDEQGQLHDRRMAKVALGQLRKRARERPTAILLFAHGWKHNADAADENVQSFQDQLIKLARRINENAKNPINVEGVYLGWRGLSLKPALVRETTFWARKRAASRIGVDGAAEIIAELASIRASGPDAKTGRHTLIMSGHSFGGALLHSATSHMLLRELVQAQECHKPVSDNSRQPMTLRPFTATAPTLPPDQPLQTFSEDDTCRHLSASVADLVMLVNPAIEHARFSPIEQRAAEIAFLPGQKPVFTVFMSKSDYPTKRLFPLGRFFSTMFNLYRDARQRRLDVNAMGHLQEHWTHELNFRDEDVGGNLYAPFYESVDGPALLWDQYVCGKRDTWDAGYGMLMRVPGTHSPYSPYMVVSVDGKGIASHTDIWGPKFTDFVERFITAGVLRPEVNCSAVPSFIPST